MKPFYPLIYLFTGLVLAFIPFSFIYLSKGNQTRLDQAENFYERGNKAETIADKEINFNRAFEIYHQLNKQYDPNYGNGKLYYNLGSTLLQLNEPAKALYYFYKSERLQPRNNSLQEPIQLAQTRLGIETSPKHSIWNQVFFFHTKLSLPERLALLGVFSLMTVILFSFYIWTKNKCALITASFIFFLTLIICLSTLYTRYFEPLEGVVVKAFILHKEANDRSSQIEGGLVSSGSLVRVLEISHRGKWLKVMTEQGVIGYVFYENVYVF